MTRARAAVLLVPFASTVLAAASGCGPQPLEAQPLNAAESERAGVVLGNAVEDAALEFGPMAVGPAVAGTAGCVTFEGDASDPDGDHVPTDALLRFDCTERRLGFTGTVIGTAHVVDGQPAQLAWAFTSAVDLDSSLTGPMGGSISRSRTGEVVARQDGLLGPFHLDRTLELITVFRRPSGSTRTIREEADWSIAYTPQLSWQPGAAPITGSLEVAGRWYVSTGSHEADASLETPVPLTLDPSCQTRVTAGAITGSFQVDDRQRAVRVTWTSCGERVVSFSEE